MTEPIRDEVERWLEAMVIGLNLCPFARRPYREGRVRIVTSRARDVDEAIDDFIDELDVLLSSDATQVSTTLLVTPHALLDFEEFLDAIASAEHILAHSGAEALVQLAHFHPDYLFEEVAPGDASHFTNRSPYPILHMLRTEEVADAIASTPGVTQIPERNIALMRQLGSAKLLKLCVSDPSSNSTGE